MFLSCSGCGGVTWSSSSFTKNTVVQYLNCAHALAAGGRTEKDEFVKILWTASESCGPEPLKEPAIYALCERKVGNPICVWRTDLRDWLESKRAADNLIRKTIEREENERTQFYSAHGIKETAEIRDQVEDKRARFYGKQLTQPRLKVGLSHTLVRQSRLQLRSKCQRGNQECSRDKYLTRQAFYLSLLGMKQSIT
jgi:hypothetical protein